MSSHIPSTEPPKQLAQDMLPPEMWIEHLRGYDIPDLLAFAQSSKACEVYASDNSIWSEIARKIHCPLKDRVYKPGEIRMRVFHFIKNLQDQTTRTGNLTICSRVKAIVIPSMSPPSTIFAKKPPSIAHIQKMQTYLKAVDKLKIQQKLAEAIDQEAPSLTGTVDEIITRASSFSAWFISNLPDLQNHVQILNLSGLGLTSLPPEIGQLSSLWWLNCSHNQISSLPSEIGQLTVLHELNCSHNKLSSLPPEIGQLTALDDLNFSHNKFSKIPPEIGLLSALTWLDYSHNPLPSLPSEIDNLSCDIHIPLKLKISPKFFFHKIQRHPIEIACTVSLMAMVMATSHKVEV